MKSEELLSFIKKKEKNQPFYASELFNKNDLHFSESAFYKALERLSEKKELLKISKGYYCLPIVSEFGVVLPSNHNMMEPYISGSKGMLVGYSLYNEINLTTQISKKYLIFSNSISGFTKNIGDIHLRKVNIIFDGEVKKHIAFMEVLSNFMSIQDLNLAVFVNYAKSFSEVFDEKCFDNMIKKIHYKKSTIAFLRDVLNYYGISNTLEKYLSPLSIYSFPKMKDIYETAFRQEIV